MKKTKINSLNRLELKKETISNLTTNQFNTIKGGGSLANSVCSNCNTQPVPLTKDVTLCLAQCITHNGPTCIQ